MIFSPEKIWEHYENKYRAINIAALYARKIKDEQLQGLIDKTVNPIKESLLKCIKGEIKYKE